LRAKSGRGTCYHVESAKSIRFTLAVAMVRELPHASRFYLEFAAASMPGVMLSTSSTQRPCHRIGFHI